MIRSRPAADSGQSWNPVDAIVYSFQPLVVVRTILCRLEQSDPTFTSTPIGLGGATVYTTPRKGEGLPLFTLQVDPEREAVRFRFRDSNSELLLSEVEEMLPDPLWEAAEGICRHMEDDHKDAFSLFLRSVGVELKDEDVTMPWVERSGFFLSLNSPEICRHVWIPFPQDCETPNEVRKTLIKMLKEIRS